jgi:hypothetical protein
VPELFDLIRDSDSVELKLTVPESGHYAAARSLDMDPLDAQIRQVYFFDTLELSLNRGGVVVRARRVQRKRGDAIVQLRPVVPGVLSKKLRSDTGFTVEVDAMPGGYVCAGTLKRKVSNANVGRVASGASGVEALLSQPQRAFLAEHAPAGFELDDLSVLGPILVLKLKFEPEGFERRLVAELWMYPDGSRVLELLTKCDPGRPSRPRPRRERSCPAGASISTASRRRRRQRRSSSSPRDQARASSRSGRRRLLTISETTVTR